MRDGGFIAIGWQELGDLSDIEYRQESKDKIRAKMKDRYGDQGSWGNEIFNFVAAIQENDMVLAFERSTVLGIGRVKGPYQYDPILPRIPHHHPVEWLSIEQWELPKPEAQGRAIREIRIPENWVEIERRIFSAPPVVIEPVGPKVNIIPQLKGIQGRI